MRCLEFTKLIVQDVKNTGNQFIFSLKDTKTGYPRSFVIGAQYYNLVNRYVALRPTGMDTDRFFVRYVDGGCTREVIGKHTVAKVPKTIAEFLNLENPSAYTGHCCRRSGTTRLANAGGNTTMVKQLGGWKSSSVAEGYIENSLLNRTNIFEKMAGCSGTSVATNIGKNLPLFSILFKNLPTAFLITSTFNVIAVTSSPAVRVNTTSTITSGLYEQSTTTSGTAKAVSTTSNVLSTPSLTFTSGTAKALSSTSNVLFTPSSTFTSGHFKPLSTTSGLFKQSSDAKNHVLKPFSVFQHPSTITKGFFKESKLPSNPEKPEDTSSGSISELPAKDVHRSVNDEIDQVVDDDLQAIFSEPFFTENPEHEDSNSNNAIKRFPLTENNNFIPSKFGTKRQKVMENDPVLQENKNQTVDEIISSVAKICYCQINNFTVNYYSSDSKKM